MYRASTLVVSWLSGMAKRKARCGFNYVVGWSDDTRAIREAGRCDCVGTAGKAGRSGSGLACGDSAESSGCWSICKPRCGPFQRAKISGSCGGVQESACAQPEATEYSIESGAGGIQARTFRGGDCSFSGGAGGATTKSAGADAAGDELLRREAIRGSGEAFGSSG